MISARTKAALAAARARGVKLGGARNDTGNLRHENAKGRAVSADLRGRKADNRAADLAPTIRDLQAAGVTSLRDIAEALNARNIPAARGGEWSAVQVRRVLVRLEEAA